ncbi:hypothetical protein DSO57_1036172 [Entomophthora muscae]|uniref:Uncharacterized protein n=1 Tax=Entomophthora muscae TaxID=34485 RepID=A0ACC2RE29_9FUNG|nr:hypothetical protein DSO57_1036172 [Entomophthora muscae]
MNQKGIAFSRRVNKGIVSRCTITVLGSPSTSVKIRSVSTALRTNTTRGALEDSWERLSPLGLDAAFTGAADALPSIITKAIPTAIEFLTILMPDLWPWRGLYSIRGSLGGDLDLTTISWLHKPPNADRLILMSPTLYFQCFNADPDVRLSWFTIERAQPTATAMKA